MKIYQYVLSTEKPSQDMPPIGGFAPIQYKEIKGPKSSVLLLGVALISTYGFYKYIQGIQEKRELKREDIWSRIHLMPLLQAEADRMIYRKKQEIRQIENQIMKDDPDYDSKNPIYNTKSNITPTFSFSLE